MQRSYATTRLIVEDSSVLQETVGVLSYHEQGAASLASVTSTSGVASLRASVESSRSNFLIVLSLFVDEMMLAMMSTGQG